MKPGIWVINANVHLKSNAVYTLNQDDELSENISTTVKITEITPIHLIISCVSTGPIVTTPFCRFNARSIE